MRISGKRWGALAAISATAIVLTVKSARAEVAPASPPTARPFGVEEVQLLDGPFRRAMEADARYILSLDDDRLLSGFRAEAGLAPKSRVYGGWESQGIAGHSLGHYLSACSRMAHAADNPEFRRRVEYVVGELAKCQEAGGDGYFAAIPNGRKIFAEVAKGDIRSQGFDLNGGWVPWYTLHKMFAGLIDAYELTGNKQALDVATRLADWVDATTQNLTPEKWQLMLACEHGGMNESLADLYELTGDKKYLSLAEKFYHQAILDPLAAQRDELEGKHANTQIPKVIGAAKIAELTGDEKFATIARFFWQTIVDNHTYVTGGNSLGEHLGPPKKLNDRLGASTTETCNTYNMLKLTVALFAQDPAAKYADFAERALWNHILASENHETGLTCYFVPLEGGATKPFQGPEAFTCCTGSGMENHARYGEYIYAHSDDTLYVTQFIASELTWNDKGVKVRQATRFPNESAVRLELTCREPQRFVLAVRRPSWATDGFRIAVNGVESDVASTPSSFVRLDRTWKTGDAVEIRLPMKLRLESMPDNPLRVAAFFGPILLAGLVDSNAASLLPVLVTDGRPVDDWLKTMNGDQMAFHTRGVGRPTDVTLAPFCDVADDHYVIYWDLFTDEEWENRKQAYEAERSRLRELEERTVDLFPIGEMQPERDHNVQGEKTGAVEFAGRKLRHAWDGGWFSFDVRLPDDAPADLIVTYWGSETGEREFDILLDGQKLATESLHRDKPEHFWERVYQLPGDQIHEKTKATIRFQAHPGNFAGGVFGVRVVKRDATVEGTSP